MYKIIKPDGVTVTTEEPNFIRVHSNGCYILCPREKAEGIAYNGTPYMFSDGVVVYETDSGTELDKHSEVNTALLSKDEAAAAEQFRRALQKFVESLDDDAAMEIAMVFDPWQAGVTYDIGARFTHGVNGVGDPQLYKSNQKHTASEIYPPGSTGTAALYTPIGLDEQGYPVWAAPTGAHDSYAVGDIVDHKGVLYISKIPGNTTVPGTDDRYWEVYTPTE